jgi:putative N6-adenine-specific DNA methylase
MADRLGGIYGLRVLPETDVKYQIEFFIFKDTATLMIDTSGVALHKRGYRPASGEAPLRETLGAAIATIARPKEDVLFWDPFCGSGTIVIEAAMIATDTAPGLLRTFAAEQFPSIGKSVWDEQREAARARIRRDSLFEAYGSDIDTDVLEKAKENARRAGVGKHIKFFEQDARRIKKIDRRRGTVACNPPYGERLMTLSEAEKLYREIGRTFDALTPWQIYVLTSADNFERLYGRRADKTRKLYNGMIPCRLYQYFKPKF